MKKAFCGDLHLWKIERSCLLLLPQEPRVQHNTKDEEIQRGKGLASHNPAFSKSVAGPQNTCVVAVGAGKRSENSLGNLSFQSRSAPPSCYGRDLGDGGGKHRRSTRHTGHSNKALDTQSQHGCQPLFQHSPSTGPGVPDQSMGWCFPRDIDDKTQTKMSASLGSLSEQSKAGWLWSPDQHPWNGLLPMVPLLGWLDALHQHLSGEESSDTLIGKFRHYGFLFCFAIMVRLLKVEEENQRMKSRFKYSFSRTFFQPTL